MSPNVPSTSSDPHLCGLSSEVSVCQKTSSLSHGGLVCTLKGQERGHHEAPASAAPSPLWPMRGSPHHSHRPSQGQKASTEAHNFLPFPVIAGGWEWEPLHGPSPAALPFAWSLSSWLAVFFQSSSLSCRGLIRLSMRALQPQRKEEVRGREEQRGSYPFS